MGPLPSPHHRSSSSLSSADPPTDVMASALSFVLLFACLVAASQAFYGGYGGYGYGYGIGYPMMHGYGGYGLGYGLMGGLGLGMHMPFYGGYGMYGGYY